MTGEVEYGTGRERLSARSRPVAIDLTQRRDYYYLTLQLVALKLVSHIRLGMERSICPAPKGGRTGVSTKDLAAPRKIWLPHDGFGSTAMRSGFL